MSLSAFYITINLGPSLTTASPAPTSYSNPGNAATYQILTPWGATTFCENFYDALDQAFRRAGSPWSGRMGVYFQTSTTAATYNTSSQSAPVLPITDINSST
jgi:hypothetical protein